MYVFIFHYDRNNFKIVDLKLKTSNLTYDFICRIWFEGEHGAYQAVETALVGVVVRVARRHLLPLPPFPYGPLLWQVHVK